MARPSRWMQFTQNFNAMNSTMNDAFKKYETGKASKADYYGDEEDDEGNKIKLTGNALQSAKNNAMANIYEKYGDNEGAMKLRKSNEELQGLMRNNRIGAATEQDQIYIQGAGARKNLDTGIAANEASTGASKAAARASNLQSDALELTAKQNATVNAILQDVGNQEFASQAEEDAYFVDKLQRSDLPPAMRNEALAAVRTFGGEALALESDRLVAGAKKAMRGGLGSFTDWYNNEVADGASVEFDTTDGVTTIYAVTGEGENQRRVEIGRGEGEDGEVQAANMLFARVQDPSTVLGAAVDNLAYRQSKQNLRKGDAQIESIESGVELNDARINQIASSMKVDAAQVQKITSDIGLTDARAAQVAAETVLTQGLKTEQLRAQVADIKAQTQQRGIQGRLDEEQIVHLAAKTAQINFNMDPERPMTRVEIDREWADFTGKMAGIGYPPEKIASMEQYFYDSLQKDRTGQFTVRPK